jgi:hypothetical protein
LRAAEHAPPEPVSAGGGGDEVPGSGAGDVCVGPGEPPGGFDVEPVGDA